MSFQNCSRTLIFDLDSRIAVDISYFMRKYYYKYRCLNKQ
jgi:hypothetical protein